MMKWGLHDLSVLGRYPQETQMKDRKNRNMLKICYMVDIALWGIRIVVLFGKTSIKISKNEKM